MAKILRWKQSEGYDLHLLRGGPESKPLRDALDVAAPPDALAFFPNLAGIVDEHGIEVDAQHGIVTARADPPPMYEVHNFILSAVFDGSAGREETEIRIHVHGTIEQIWLTPSSLWVHQGTNETRFTVLARFKDGVIGDITGCPQLSYKSVDPVTHADSTDVLVSADGILKAVSPDKTAQLTATLTLPPAFPTLTSPPATVATKASWADFAKRAIVTFVAGPVVPNKGDAATLKSVVDAATNILLISEGFRQDQRGDFNNLVYIVVEELRTKTYLLPFPLLKNTINFWSAFVPSEEEGISVLGDWAFEDVHFKGDLVPAPRKPAPTATKWSLPELIHEVGLPIFDEVFQAGLPDYVAHWQKFYGPQVTEARAGPFFLKWNTLVPRSPLNERNSAFGIAGSFRPRADPERRQGNDLAFDFRRTSEANLLLFATNLTYGGLPFGSTWQTGGKDFGLVSFVCLSDFHLGQMRTGKGCFTATVGRNQRLDLQKSASLGFDLKTAPIETNSRTLFASAWSHECGHVLGLLDEYGDGQGTIVPAGTVLDGPNMVLKQNLCSVSTSPTGSTITTFDKTTQIPWLWPRLAKAGILGAKPTRASSGLPYQFQVPLRHGHSLSFEEGDAVRFREWPVNKRASLDGFLKFQTSFGFLFKVKKPDPDTVGLNLVDGTGANVDVDSPVPTNPGQKSWSQTILALFDPALNYALICPKVDAGVELRLIAEPIFNWLTNGPLNVEPGFNPGLCVPARPYNSIMSPINLPVLKNKPRAPADIIGLYEGGFYHDCGAYRPAGRCKMRADNEKTLPFCHVCRYVMVDRVDPTQHAGLEAFYPEVSI